MSLKSFGLVYCCSSIFFVWKISHRQFKSSPYACSNQLSIIPPSLFFCPPLLSHSSCEASVKEWRCTVGDSRKRIQFIYLVTQLGQSWQCFFHHLAKVWRGPDPSRVHARVLFWVRRREWSEQRLGQISLLKSVEKYRHLWKETHYKTSKTLSKTDIERKKTHKLSAI